jgi:mannose PTS system EIIA component
MIGVIVAAHGNLAEALVEAALLVVPEGRGVAAVGITVGDDSTSYEAKLRSAMQGIESGRGVLILTDMFGGTPSNIGLTLHQPGKVEVLTGANLPMLIRALQLSRRDVDLVTAAREVKEYGGRAIAVASEVLGAGAATKKEKLA